MVNRYGYIREVEADFLDRIIDRVYVQFGRVDFLEVGVFGGGTVTGIVRECRKIGCPISATGIDFKEWKPATDPCEFYTFHDCDSMDAWRNITGKFNLLFVDGCHCINHAMCDFLNYSPFLEVGGYALFHDTALPKGKESQEEFPQDHSYAGKPPSTLGVREGLTKLGLLQGHRADWYFVEEIESETGLMGMCLFQKVKELCT